MQFFSPRVTCENIALGAEHRYTWTVPAIEPFDELLISWNAVRPLIGQYVILVSIFHHRWSPWLLYAVWGAEGQYSFHETTSDSPVHTFQDQVEILDGEQATGFRIRVEACSGATLNNFSRLIACTSLIKASKRPFIVPSMNETIEIPLKGFSQLKLQHPRANSFCSPTSSTAFIHHAKASQLDPVSFAQNVYDSAFDIYGHWPFNMAQAYVELGKQWQCHCARLSGFDALLASLRQGIPVVVSVKGIISRNSGHLLMIRGYDPDSQKVLCMDPAYLTDQDTLVSYPVHDFMQSWENRHYLAYIMNSTTHI